MNKPPLWRHLPASFSGDDLFSFALALSRSGPPGLNKRPYAAIGLLRRSPDDD